MTEILSKILAQAQEIPEDPHSTHQQDLIDIKVNMQEKYDTNILGTIKTTALKLTY